ncbi:MAG: potassium transporter Kup [Armatimonadetes bacterium]|nr:potassium transporter Kup [Armatimonadota bacterium]
MKDRLLLLAVGALGIVYGDIGTSPLYSIREAFHHSHALTLTEENVLGILSLICWSLTVLVSIKYVIFVVRADHYGEGGVLALTTLVTHSGAKAARAFPILAVLGLFGTSLLYGDGIITPAISVLSAVEGLSLATPAFNPYILPITVAIIVLLFLGQSSGTEKVGRLFGPVTLVWFLTLALLGIWHLIQEPRVLVALNPMHGLEFILRNGVNSLWPLASVVLVITGGEALYADMGHFGRAPVRLAWFSVVFPALLLNYFGQGSLLLRNPEAIENPFYYMVPSWGLYPTVLIATAATVIASQALISGAFSLTMQAVQLGFMPRMRVEHTSSETRGQIYVPAVNWTLMVLCLALVLGFRTSSALAAAYGVAVTITMLVTTLLFAYYARYAWNWSLPGVVALAALFMTFELTFTVANCLKIPHGGWFPLAIAGSVYLVMITWRKGRNKVAEILDSQAVPFDRLLARLAEKPPIRVPGTAVFMFRNPDGTPAALLRNLEHNHVLHERNIVLHVQTVEPPYARPEERVEVSPCGNGFYRVTVRFGYMEQPDVPTVLEAVEHEGLPLVPPDASYFLGRETVLPRRWVASGMAFWREKVFAFLLKNSRDATSFFNIPVNRVIELGSQIEI